MMPPGWRASLADGFSGICDAVWSSFLILFAAGPAHAFAGEFDSVGVMDQAIEDGVGIGRIADDLMPTVYGKLRSDERGAAAVSLLEDFEQIVTSGGVERLQAPI